MDKVKVRVLGNSSLAFCTATCVARHHLMVSESPEILWVCYDTPIGHGDEPDWEWVCDQIGLNLPKSDCLILVSSQLPVGTTKILEDRYPFHHFAHSPENIRVATAVADFEQQARIVVGRRDQRWDNKLFNLLSPFTDNIIWTDPETAEMVKHSLNAFLGLNIAFINEIARVSAKVGANPETISRALKAERRISPNAPLRPGPKFGLGHLARDLYVLGELANKYNIPIPIITHIRESNDHHSD